MEGRLEERGEGWREGWRREGRDGGGEVLEDISTADRTDRWRPNL